MQKKVFDDSPYNVVSEDSFSDVKTFTQEPESMYDFNRRRALEYIEKNCANQYAVMLTMQEDECFEVWMGTKQEIENLAAELLFEMSDDAFLSFFENGKEVPHQVNVSF